MVKSERQELELRLHVINVMLQSYLDVIDDGHWILATLFTQHVRDLQAEKAEVERRLSMP